MMGRRVAIGTAVVLAAIAAAAALALAGAFAGPRRHHAALPRDAPGTTFHSCHRTPSSSGCVTSTILCRHVSRAGEQVLLRLKDPSRFLGDRAAIVRFCDRYGHGTNGPVPNFRLQ